MGPLSKSGEPKGLEGSFPSPSAMGPAPNFHCKDCDEVLSFKALDRGSGYCDDCEFDHLTPSAWMELFQAAVEAWKENKAT